MLWLTVRQFRVQALVAAAGLVILGRSWSSSGQHVLHDWSTVSGGCAKSGQLFRGHQRLRVQVPGDGSVARCARPGGPRDSSASSGAHPWSRRELETGTFRLAWAQSVSRRRWTLTKLAVLGLSGIAVAGVCSLLITWWASPLDQLGAGPFSHFDSRGIVPLAYAALAFTLGVATGAAIRRTVSAMIVTLVGFVGLRVFLAEVVRPHLMAPLVNRNPFQYLQPRRVTIGHNLPRGAWVVSESIVNKAGHAVSGGQLGFGLRHVRLHWVGGCLHRGCRIVPQSQADGQPGRHERSGAALRQPVAPYERDPLPTVQPLLAVSDLRVAALPGPRPPPGRAQRVVGAPPHQLT